MPAACAGGEARDVAGAQDRLALRSAERQLAVDHDQPLLLGRLEVVRPGGVAGRKLVDAHAGRHRVEALGQRRRGEPVTRGAAVALPEREREEVRDTLRVAHAADPSPAPIRSELGNLM
jgi:hypothetical protein